MNALNISNLENLTPSEKNQVLLNNFNNIAGCKFVTFKYRSKGTKELAIHTILVGSFFEKLYRNDLDKLTALQIPENSENSALFIQAKNKLIDSIKNSLEKGIGNNDAYTLKDYYKPTDNRNIKTSDVSGKFYLNGYAISKITLEEGIYKEVKHKPLTIAQKTLERDLKLKKTKIRTFILDIENMKNASLNGNRLTFDYDETPEKQETA